MRKTARRLPAALIVATLVACGGGGGSGGANPPPVVNPPPPNPPLAQTCLADVPALTTRALADRVDDVTGPQLHLVYAIPADGIDAELDINGQIQTEMEVAQRWLQEQTGRCMSMDTFGGALDVTFVQFARTNREMRNDPDFVDQTISLEFEALGLDDPNKIYVVYYGGSSDNGSCGGASAVGGPAMQFLNLQALSDGSLRDCPFFEFVSDPDAEFRGTWSGVAVHEAFHALGVAPFCAPDHDDAHPLHLETISSDLMAFDGSGFNTYTLDAGRAQYYDHNNTGCLDLADSAVWEDAAAGAEPLPGRESYTTPRAIACADEPTTRSATNGARVPVRFANTTGAPVNFQVLDGNGVRQNAIAVDAYSDPEIEAGVGDVFVATDANSGECRGVFELVDGFNRILIVD